MHRICFNLSLQVSWGVGSLELHLEIAMINIPERSQPHCSMHGVVVHEICQWQEVIPVILLVVAEGTEILFHGPILALRLALSLWMEGC
jgi:hypothetical protein